MSSLPSGSMDPILDVPSLQALKADHERLRYLVDHMPATLRGYINALGDKSGGVRIATVDAVIPGRQRIEGPPIRYVPGGPVQAQLYRLDAGDIVADGDPVDVYSWVKSASEDPQGETDGLLWIAVGRDDDSVYWFIAQDCTDLAATLIEGELSADVVVTTTETALPGTQIAAPVEGYYVYALDVFAIYANVPGGQRWDLDLTLYNVTTSSVLRTWSFAGTGQPPADEQTFNVARNAFIPETTVGVGDTVEVRVKRATTAGTITISRGGGNATVHSILGPMK